MSRIQVKLGQQKTECPRLGSLVVGPHGVGFFIPAQVLEEIRIPVDHDGVVVAPALGTWRSVANHQVVYAPPGTKVEVVDD